MISRFFLYMNMYIWVQIQKSFSYHDERSRMKSNIHKQQQWKSEYKVEKLCILGSSKFCGVVIVQDACIMHSQSNHSLQLNAKLMIRAAN